MGGISFFVSWDERPSAHDATHHAFFTNRQDADAFYQMKAAKAKSDTPVFYVWFGEIGRQSPEHRLDYFHTNWTPGAEPARYTLPSAGCGYSGSGKGQLSRKWTSKPFAAEPFDFKLS